jgi:hypothetical protein
MAKDRRSLLIGNDVFRALVAEGERTERWPSALLDEHLCGGLQLALPALVARPPRRSSAAELAAGGCRVQVSLRGALYKALQDVATVRRVRLTQLADDTLRARLGLEPPAAEPERRRVAPPGAPRQRKPSVAARRFRINPPKPSEMQRARELQTHAPKDGADVVVPTRGPSRVAIRGRTVGTVML